MAQSINLPRLPGGVLILVNGVITKRGKAPKPFSQTFFLTRHGQGALSIDQTTHPLIDPNLPHNARHPTQQSQKPTDAHYYVLNDIFRSIDAPAPATAASTPQAAASAPAAVGDMPS